MNPIEKKESEFQNIKRKEKHFGDPKPGDSTADFKAKDDGQLFSLKKNETKKELEERVDEDLEAL